MSKHTNRPLTTHSFAWQRVGLLLSLSLMAAPMAPAVAPMVAGADELPAAQQVEVASTAASTAPSEPSVHEAAAEPEQSTPESSEASPETGLENAPVETAAEAPTTSSSEVESGGAAPEPAKTAESDGVQASGSEAAEPVAEAQEGDLAAVAGTDQTLPDVTLLYEANDTTDVVKTGVLHEGSVVLPSADSLSLKAPAGTVFGGWYIPTKTTVHFYKAGDTLTMTKEQVDKLAKDKTPLKLYALWIDPDQQEDTTLGVAKTPVYFTSAPEEGGTLSEHAAYVPDSKETVMDSVVAEPASGYVFGGWYKDGEKISDDAVLDPTSIEGVISTDEKPASPAVICASFVPESEAEPQDVAPDLSTWRDPDSIAREQGIVEPSAEEGGASPTAEDPHDDLDTTADTAQEPSMNDPELIDQAAQSLNDPKFEENAMQINDPANDVLVSDPTNPTNTSGDTAKATAGTAATTTTTSGSTSASPTKTTTPYSSYTHYTAPTSSTYKSPYTSSKGTSAYTGSTYKPSTTTSTYPYSAARTTQLAQTSDNALVALAICMTGFVAAVAGIAFMTLRGRSRR